MMFTLLLTSLLSFHFCLNALIWKQISNMRPFGKKLKTIFKGIDVLSTFSPPCTLMWLSCTKWPPCCYVPGLTSASVVTVCCCKVRMSWLCSSGSCWHSTCGGHKVLRSTLAEPQHISRTPLRLFQEQSSTLCWTESSFPVSLRLAVTSVMGKACCWVSSLRLTTNSTSEVRSRQPACSWPDPLTMITSRAMWSSGRPRDWSIFLRSESRARREGWMLGRKQSLEIRS